MRLLPLAWLVVLWAILSLPPLASAQETRSLRWDRYDVSLDLRPNGSVRACEVQEITFVQGTFSTASRGLPLERVVSIQEVEVSEGGQVFRPGDGRTPNTFNTTQNLDADGRSQLRVAWGYPPSANRSRTFTICYTVFGGLRVYEDYYQLEWRPLSQDRPFTVASSTTTVRLPQEAPRERLLPNTGGQVGLAATVIDGRTVRFAAGSVPANETYKIGLRFPRAVLNASAPPWQARVDAEEAEAQRLQPLKDLANLALGGLSLLLAVGGAIGAYALWYNRGRDLPVGKVAEYLREPPEAVAPAVVGTLIDEQADLRDILATIPWLGARGVLKITEIEEPGLLGLGGGRDYLFQRQASDEALSAFEQSFLEALLRGSDEARLSQAKGVMLARMPAFHQLLYSEVVERGYFRKDPNATRKRYRTAGCGVMALAVVLMVVASPIALFAGWVYLPLIVGLALGILILFLARAMPQRTRAGALARAKWLAFRRYLEQIERHEQLNQAREIFDRYLAYATAFGLARDWVRKFETVNVAAPRWYGGGGPIIIDSGGGYGYPGGHGSYQSGGHHGGWGGGATGGGSGGGRVEDAGAGGGGFDWQQASDSGLGSVQNASDRLLDMLNSAGQVFGGSSDSGGWGGGGDSGGSSDSGGGGGSSSYE